VASTLILVTSGFSFSRKPEAGRWESGNDFPVFLRLSPALRFEPELRRARVDRKRSGGAEDDSGRDEGKRFQPSPRGWRAFIECGTIMGVSQANYWRRYIDWVEDWQFKFNWDDQTRRLFTGDGWRFDSNSFFTNWGHGVSGAIYYNTFRTNYHSWSRSLLFASLASFYWELLVEWREVISINDNIFTTIGGFPVGEVLFQTGSFLQSRTSPFARIFGGLLNPILAFNRWLDRKRPFADPVFAQHDFRFFAGHRSGENPAGEQQQGFAEFGLSADLVRVPGFGLPGGFSQWRADILSSYLDIRLLLGAHGLQEYEILARTMPWGWAWQDLTPGTDHDVCGHSLLAGLVTAFELYGQRQYWEYDRKDPFFRPPDYDQIPLPTQFSDKYCMIHLGGPRVEWRYHGRGFHVKTAAETTLDFGMIGAYALNDYTSPQFNSLLTAAVDGPLAGMKSTLANYGYYYGLGLTASLEVVLRMDPGVEWSAWFRTWVSNSIEGLDRFDEDIDDSMNIRDSRSRLGTSLGYRIPGTPIQMRLTYEHVSRRGRMAGIISRERDSRLSMHLCFGL